MRMIIGLGSKVYEERLKELGRFSLVKQGKGGHLAVFKYLND